jgi:hypothetical protein
LIHFIFTNLQIKIKIMLYGFYSRLDPNQEIINRLINISRLKAAESFANRKRLDLKSFLKIYGVKKLR